MKRLNLNSICDIVYRLRRGQSERGVAKDLGHSRHTVRHYHCLAREKGYLDLHRAVPEPWELLRELGPAPSALIELPAEPFELVRVAQCTVARDTFIALDGSYYQAPYQLVGRKLDVYVYERTVQIYDGVELLVTYERATRKGQRLSRDEFYPPQESLYLTRPRAQCSYLASLVGPKCHQLVDDLLGERPWASRA